MLPANRDPSQNNSVGFPLPAETRRLSVSLRNFNAVVVVILLSVAVWYCNQIHIWELGKGTIWAFFLHRYWGIIPIVFAVLPVAAWSVPMLYLQDKAQKKELIVENRDIPKLR